MELYQLFECITATLTYIIPGFLFMLVYGYITNQKVYLFNSVHSMHILMYIAISYVLNILVKCFYTGIYQLIIIIIVSILLGIIIGVINNLKLKHIGGKSFNANPIDELIRNDNKAVIAYILLKNQHIQCRGKVFLISDGLNPNYILYDYYLDLLDESGKPTGYTINTDGRNMYIYIRNTDIERIEFELFKNVD